MSGGLIALGDNVSRRGVRARATCRWNFWVTETSSMGARTSAEVTGTRTLLRGQDGDNAEMPHYLQIHSHMALVLLLVGMGGHRGRIEARVIIRGGWRRGRLK
eukprot:GFKZ01006936.1.p1 GENE.GFKZ01006936.1~~GFKZ01006936.1.p1  ORF type:complete len:103 (+),score=5.15 GFKZ01006936.1:559-867(+)